MPLTEEQKAGIAAQRANPRMTLRAVSPGMEAWLFHAIPVLDHGLIRVVDYMGEDSAIVHLNNMHKLSFGERDGVDSQRLQSLANVLGGAGFDTFSSRLIVQEVWEKWVFLAPLAAASCLMRATPGNVLKARRGEPLILSMLDECRAIAEGAGHVPRAAFLDQARSTLTTAGSPLVASMLRDVQADAAIEADQIIGDLLNRQSASGKPARLLSGAYTHLKAYEAKRERMRSQTTRRADEAAAFT